MTNRYGTPKIKSGHYVEYEADMGYILRFARPEDVEHKASKLEEGYYWEIFDGFDMQDSGRIYPTEQEAREAADETLEDWVRRDAESAAKGHEIRMRMKKTFQTKENALINGLQHPMEYTCYECGATYWAEKRISDYSKSLYGIPTCPICDVDDPRHMIIGH